MGLFGKAKPGAAEAKQHELVSNGERIGLQDCLNM
jgi:hypothetical protein